MNANRIYFARDRHLLCEYSDCAGSVFFINEYPSAEDAAAAAFLANAHLANVMAAE